MKFLSIYKTVERGTPPSAEDQAVMGKLIGEGSKEVVGGLAVLQANSKEEAIEYVKQFLGVAGDGECELRQLYEPGANPCA